MQEMMTIDDLAKMTAKGFSAMDERFDRMEARMDRFEKRTDELEKSHNRRLTILESHVFGIKSA